MLLYKYVNPARIDIIKSGRIGFSEPMVFNDPFEMLPYFKSISEEDDFKKVFNAFGEVEKEKFISCLFEVLQPLSRGIISFEKFQAEVKSAWPEMEEQFTKSQDKIMSDFRAMLKLEIGTRFGVLSLTENYNNLLMWAHYAQNHEGFIIEFDTQNEFFEQKSSYPDPFNFFGKVQYSKQRPNQSHYIGN